MRRMSIEALQRAIDLFPTQDAFAAALNIKSPSVSEWRKRGIVPHERCADIERITEGKVTRAELRPDLWGEQAA
jgi:DNA-binding transcriptional regulator YdaS (Cro superfamily)